MSSRINVDRGRSRHIYTFVDRRIEIRSWNGPLFIEVESLVLLDLSRGHRAS